MINQRAAHLLVFALLLGLVPAWSQGNLLSNGDFSQGNAGFISNYSYSPNDCSAGGQIVVVTNPNSCNSAGPSFGDHTTGTGPMLVVNGALEPNVVVWQQTVAVVPGSHYTFQGWSADWSNDLFGSPSPANLQVLINGAVVATVAVDPRDGNWTRFTAEWDAQGATQATIQIVDTVIESVGNDFALDDFSFTGTAAPPCTVNVTAVHMLDSHTLGVTAQGMFSASAGSSKMLAVNATVNGTPLVGSFALPAGATGQQSHVFALDLAASHVARFTNNVTFPVAASMSETGVSSCTSQPATGAVLLPAVIVPDIRGGMGGDGTYPALEQYLAGAMPQGALGDAYVPGVTLRTVAYDTDQASFSDGAAALSTMVCQLMASTYAAKVNVIAYGKGGLVLRSYLSNTGSPATVNQAIFCVTPHSGTPWSAVTLDHSAAKPYTNLLPAYNWSRSNSKQNFADSPPNHDIQRLIVDALPAGPNYSVFYSSSDQTPVTQTSSGPVGIAAGDQVVPDFSQMGQTWDPNNPSAPPTDLPGFAGIFREAIPGAHFGYLANPPVMQELARCLRAGSCH
jgi:hypothetical protein